MTAGLSTILISTCCKCGKHYGVKDARGAAGGESHGFCDKCFPEAKRSSKTAPCEETFRDFNEEDD